MVIALDSAVAVLHIPWNVVIIACYHEAQVTQALDAFTRLIEGVLLLKQQLIFKIQFYTILHNFAIFCKQKGRLLEPLEYCLKGN